MAVIIEELRQILEEILKRKKVGTLSLGREERHRDIFFEADNVYLLNRGNLHKLVLHKELKTLPGVTGELLAKLAAEAQTTNETVPDILRRRGLIDDAVYERLFYVQIREEMLDAILTCRGSFVFQDGHVPADLLEHEGFAAKVCLRHEEFAEALRMREEQLRAAAAILPSDAEVCLMTEKGLAARKGEHNFKFTAICDLVDGSHTVREILQIAPFYEATVRLQLAAFLEHGLIKKTALPELQGIDPAALGAEDAAAAIPRFEHAVKYAADMIVARERLAAAYQAVGRTVDAQAQLEYIGDTFAGAARPDKAVQAYTRALAIDPTYSVLREKIARLHIEEGARLEAAGDTDAAIQLFRRALEAQPGASQVYVTLADLLQKHHKLDALRSLVDEALEYARRTADWMPADALFDRLQSACGDDLQLNKTFVNMLLDRGKKEAALARMDEIAAHHLSQGEQEKAIDLYRKILRLEPNRPEAQQALKKLACKPEKSPRKPLGVRTAVLAVILIFMGYQSWSFLEFYRVVEAVENEDGTEADYERFISLHPVSLSQILARARLHAATEERSAVAHVRRTQLRKRWDEAEFAEALGDLDKARALYSDIRGNPRSPLAAKAAEKLANLGTREREAAELLALAHDKADQGSFDESYAAMRKLLSAYAGTAVVAKGAWPKFFYPLSIETAPPGAEVRIDGALRGTTPLALRVPVASKLKIDLRLKGHKPVVIENHPSEQHVVACSLSREHAWSRTLAAPVDGTVCVAGDLLLAPGREGTVRSFSAANGAELGSWHAAGATDIITGPLLCGGMIAFATNDGRLGAIGADGKLSTWTLGMLITSPVAPAGAGRLCFTTSRGKLICFSLERKTTAWEREFAFGAAPRAASAKGTVMFMGEDGVVRAYAAATGAPAWEMRADASAALAADGDTVLLAGARRVTLADAAGGGRLWEKTFPEDIAGTLLAEGELWICLKNKQLLAFTARDGKARAATTFAGAAAVWKQTPHELFVVVDGRQLTCLDRSTLDSRWHYAAPGTITAVQTIGDRVYIVIEDRILACIVPGE